MDALDHYIHAFSHLHTDKNRTYWADNTHHRAPHKPLLLLSVLDLFAEGAILHNRIELTPELGELFRAYWSTFMSPDRARRIWLPFFHLRGDKFWHLLYLPGKERLGKSGMQIGSALQLQESVDAAYLDDELYVLLHNAEAREVLRHTLISTYFLPHIQRLLQQQGLVNVESFEYSELLLTEAKHRRIAETAGQEYQPDARDQGFRRAVVTTYDHRCAFCGTRVRTIDGHTVVDASHIVPWSISHDDDLHNGIALCRLCHWTFDQGLLGVNQKYVIISSPQLQSDGNLPGPLPALVQRTIIGPPDQALWPDPKRLHWHQSHVFQVR